MLACLAVIAVAAYASDKDEVRIHPSPLAVGRLGGFFNSSGLVGEFDTRAHVSCILEVGRVQGRLVSCSLEALGLGSVFFRMRIILYTLTYGADA